MGFFSYIQTDYCVVKSFCDTLLVIGGGVEKRYDVNTSTRKHTRKQRWDTVLVFVEHFCIFTQPHT
ncbi:MAG: hypothetical protein ACI8RD_001076 [Bacillariaceae sp.]|jgi:hypothetical protein